MTRYISEKTKFKVSFLDISNLLVEDLLRAIYLSQAKTGPKKRSPYQEKTFENT
jgi:hypothetical protein